MIDNMAAPAVLGDDARRDGQPQAGTSILGRKMRQKKLVFVFGRNAIAGIRDGNFHGLSVGKRLCGNSDLAERRSEEHTSELQSRLHLVCRLLLEKKKPPQTPARMPALSPATPTTTPERPL